LIASNKVEGTPAYKRDGEQLGNVYNLMVDKYTGQVAYAVMSFGGFLASYPTAAKKLWHSHGVKASSAMWRLPTNQG
jgi:hypothetical protein